MRWNLCCDLRNAEVSQYTRRYTIVSARELRRRGARGFTHEKQGERAGYEKASRTWNSLFSDRAFSDRSTPSFIRPARRSHAMLSQYKNETRVYTLKRNVQSECVTNTANATAPRIVLSCYQLRASRVTLYRVSRTPFNRQSISLPSSSRVRRRRSIECSDIFLRRRKIDVEFRTRRAFLSASLQNTTRKKYSSLRINFVQFCHVITARSIFTSQNVDLNIRVNSAFI